MLTMILTEDLESLPNEVKATTEGKSVAEKSSLSFADAENPSGGLDEWLGRHADSGSEAFVIGGRDILKALPYCRKVLDFGFGPEAIGCAFGPVLKSLDGNGAMVYERKLKLVIFDMDGLMIDSERIAQAAWKEAGAKCAVEMSDEFVLSLVGANKAIMTPLFEKKFGKDSLERLYRVSKGIMAEMIEKEGLQAKKGLHEILDFLKRHGIKRAVATATRKGAAVKSLSRVGILEEFDNMIFGDEIERGKPDPEIYIKSLEHFDMDRESAFVLEDSKLGLLSAVSAGIRCIVVPDLIKPDEETKRLAYAVAEDLLEAKRLIGRSIGYGN
ncbi:MAG: HAD family phosphatase [Clostridiales bacterium]|jgi:HAD superfamily hydrolase (TIGR01509 family)|nr:HAD family phosphatase [Clostridiales bacterium]